mmetsp:Transcript_6998/g.17495  ORF Transcript_6998/g.17495 Transcript_6998/m.17495 type:complete len:260 (-) Transcript_6998:181-960(-)
MHRLVCPVDLVVVVDLDVAVLKRMGLFLGLDECRHVLACVLGALRDELLVETVVFALLADVDARTISAAEEQLWLEPLRVKRIVVPPHRVVIGIPLEVENVPELLRGLLHLLFGVLHAKVVPLNQFKFLLGLALATFGLRQLEQVHLGEGTGLHQTVLLLTLLKPFLLAFLAFPLPFLLAPFPLPLALFALPLPLSFALDFLLQKEVFSTLRSLFSLLFRLVFLAARLLLGVPVPIRAGHELELRSLLLFFPLSQHLLQ